MARGSPFGILLLSHCLTGLDSYCCRPSFLGLRFHLLGVGNVVVLAPSPRATGTSEERLKEVLKRNHESNTKRLEGVCGSL